MENNPYQAPESELASSNDVKRSVWWKIYFFIITILSSLGMMMFFFDPNVGLAEYIYLPIFLMSTVGLFGFVFIKPVYKPEFWLKVFFACLAYAVIYNFITDIDHRLGMSDIEYYISMAFGWLVSIPGYYAIYAYSKRSYPAWKTIS